MGGDAIYGRGAQGSLTSCDETDHAAACDADLGEYYDHRTPWFSNGIGGSCSRTVTCLDYTSSCSHLADPAGDPGWNPDGKRACNVNSDEYGSTCAADFVRWEYVPDDIANPSGGGQCQEVWSCSGNACNDVTRGGFMNAQTRSVEIEKTQTCQGCDALPMRVTLRPETTPNLDECPKIDNTCAPVDLDTQPEDLLPDLPASMTATSRIQSIDACGHTPWVWTAALDCALRFLVANADIACAAACAWAGPTIGSALCAALRGESDIRFVVTQAVRSMGATGRAGYHHPDCDGFDPCCPGFTGGRDGLTWQIIDNAYVSSSSENSANCSYGLCDTNTVYVNVARGTTINRFLAAGGCTGATTELVELASLVLHEMMHILTGEGHGDAVDVNGDIDLTSRLSNCDDAAYVVADGFRADCNSRYGTNAGEPG